jgi:hypothetical protein
MTFLCSTVEAQQPGAPVAMPQGAQPAPQAPGLVTFKTSDTRFLEEIEIDPVEGRRRNLKRGVLSGARLIEFALANRRARRAMLTLTYRDIDAFEPRHISQLLKHIRHWLRRRGHRFHYVWVAELQGRGALHYHVLVWLPRGLSLPKPDKQGWWRHGSTRIE